MSPKICAYLDAIHAAATAAASELHARIQNAQLPPGDEIRSAAIYLAEFVVAGQVVLDHLCRLARTNTRPTG